MSRRRTAKKRVIVPDPIYKNVLIETLVRHIKKKKKKFLKRYNISNKTLGGSNEKDMFFDNVCFICNDVFRGN